jgi:hypothetical protein
MSDTKEPSDCDNNCAEHLCISRTWNRGITGRMLFQQEVQEGVVQERREKKKGKRYIIIDGEFTIEAFDQVEAAELCECATMTFRAREKQAMALGLNQIVHKNGIIAIWGGIDG